MKKTTEINQNSSGTRYLISSDVHFHAHHHSCMNFQSHCNKDFTDGLNHEPINSDRLYGIVQLPIQPSKSVGWVAVGLFVPYLSVQRYNIILQDDIRRLAIHSRSPSQLRSSSICWSCFRTPVRELQHRAVCQSDQ